MREKNEPFAALYGEPSDLTEDHEIEAEPELASDSNPEPEPNEKATTFADEIDLDGEEPTPTVFSEEKLSISDEPLPFQDEPSSSWGDPSLLSNEYDETSSIPPLTPSFQDTPPSDNDILTPKNEVKPATSSFAAAPPLLLLNPVRTGLSFLMRSQHNPETIEQLLEAYSMGASRVGKMTRSNSNSLLSFDKVTGRYWAVHHQAAEDDPLWLEALEAGTWQPGQAQIGKYYVCVVVVPSFTPGVELSAAQGALAFQRAAEMRQYNCDELSIIRALAQEISALSVHFSSRTSSHVAA